MKLTDAIDLGRYKRVGITTQLGERLEDHKRRFVKVSDWNVHGPFEDREAAQAWEDGHDDTWEHHPGGAEPDAPDAKWYGYTFWHEGERKKRRG